MSTYYPMTEVQPSNLSNTDFNYSSQQSASLSIAQTIVKMLCDMGVTHAFGVSGGGIVPLWTALEQSSIQVCHFRHESGAAFAATELYFASGRPVVVFTTTGPGLINALSGMFAARWEGAKVILLSGYTPVSQHGRSSLQETSSYTMPISGIFTSGTLFHYAVTPHSSFELPQIARRLAIGLAQPNGFTAHISVSTDIQNISIKASKPNTGFVKTLVSVTQEEITQCVQLLNQGAFAIWIGFGARNAAPEILQLAEQTGAAVMCSPRGKGIFPETHPQFIGVTGFAGHSSVLSYMQTQRPKHLLVLGTRLGEFTSFWNPDMLPEKELIHVDIDPEVPGTAYPSARTFSIQSDIKLFIKSLLKNKLKLFKQRRFNASPYVQCENTKTYAKEMVRPQVLMEAIQNIVVENSNALVMAEGGNSFAWAINLLKFKKPGRFRVSTSFSAMGHFTTGVVGATLGYKNKAVAIVGDGSMLMNNEISTAVKFQIPAIWIVLNDSCYNMCAQGIKLLGYKSLDTEIPRTDFKKMANSLGAGGVVVQNESALKSALNRALTSKIPFVVDVIIDPTQIAPIDGRIESLINQKTRKKELNIE